ncbi:MAG TPA: hypothetical protein VHV51_14575 [Polyangiaceae bacterium]|jgi:hypothetical protein|nr:hypothetical protein [Polyangiaceae bacterium]
MMKLGPFFWFGFALCVAACAAKRPGSAPVPTPTIERAADTKIPKDGGPDAANQDKHVEATH